jgi:hypothetical protein
LPAFEVQFLAQIDIDCVQFHLAGSDHEVTSLTTGTQTADGGLGRLTVEEGKVVAGNGTGTRVIFQLEPANLGTEAFVVDQSQIDTGSCLVAVSEVVGCCNGSRSGLIFRGEGCVCIKAWLQEDGSSTEDEPQTFVGTFFQVRIFDPVALAVLFYGALIFSFSRGVVFATPVVVIRNHGTAFGHGDR